MSMNDPLSRDSQTNYRWTITKRKRRLISGLWEKDATEHRSQILDAARAASWGRVSSSVNLFDSAMSQLAVLYDNTPTISNQNISLSSEQIDVVNNWGLFSKSQQHNKNTLALGDSCIKLSWNFDKNKPLTTLVTPDMIEAKSNFWDPSTPVLVREFCQKVNPADGKVAWYIEEWSIEDLENPYFKILTAEKETDVTSLFRQGENAYPYYNIETKRPFLPYVLYHAQDTGELFQAEIWEDLVQGSLDVSVLVNMFQHSVYAASWAQKWGLNVNLEGLSQVGSGHQAASRVATDPGSILLFTSDNGGSLGTFQSPQSPMEIVEAIEKYSNMLVQNLGVLSIDATMKVAQSGVSISLKRDKLRQMQQTFSRQFAIGDVELLEKACAMHNLFTDEFIPSQGWNVKYNYLITDLSEKNQKLDYLLKLKAAGLIGDRYILRELEVNLDEAEIDLIKDESMDEV